MFSTLGPAAVCLGGEVVAQGAPKEVVAVEGRVPQADARAAAGGGGVRLALVDLLAVIIAQIDKVVVELICRTCYPRFISFNLLRDFRVANFPFSFS